MLKNVVISDETLSGKIDPHKFNSRNKINIYLLADSALRIFDRNIIIQLNSIDPSVKLVEVAQGKTFLLVVACMATLLWFAPIFSGDLRSIPLF